MDAKREARIRAVWKENKSAIIGSLFDRSCCYVPDELRDERFIGGRLADPDPVGPVAVLCFAREIRVLGNRDFLHITCEGIELTSGEPT